MEEDEERYKDEGWRGWGGGFQRQRKLCDKHRVKALFRSPFTPRVKQRWGGGEWGTMSHSGVHVSLRQDAGWGSRSVAPHRQSARGGSRLT